MFEGFTLEQQRIIEVERGWKPNYSALTYCTAEAVLFRKPTGRSASDLVLDYEILDAVRTTGAPDCVGKHQGKWGTYIMPKHRDGRTAYAEMLKNMFGWGVRSEMDIMYCGTVGPWFHKATAALQGSQALRLIVADKQAEATPFKADLFCVNVTDCRLPPDGNYLKSTKDARWVTVAELIREQGSNEDYLYWLMLAICFRRIAGAGMYMDSVGRYYPPGEYLFSING
jgi:hypothetical protein